MSQQDHQNRKSEGKPVEKIQGMGQDSSESSHDFTLASADEAEVKKEARRQGRDQRSEE